MHTKTIAMCGVGDSRAQAKLVAKKTHARLVSLCNVSYAYH